MDALIRLVLVIVLAGAALFASIWTLRIEFIYIFDETLARPADIPRTEVKTIAAYEDEPPLTVWVTEPEPGYPIIVYFMGEAGSLSVYETRLRRFAEAGLGVAAMAYRGGGGQQGAPDEAAFHRDATRVYGALHELFDRPIKDTQRVIYGYSLGTGIAARLAAEQEELALILEAPYTRLCDANVGLAGMLPGCILMRGQEFELASVIDEVGAPVLVIHGEADARVPVAQGRAVFDAAVDPKFLRLYQAGHDDLPRAGAMDDAISFIRVLAGLR